MSTKTSILIVGTLALAAPLGAQTKADFPWYENFEQPLVKWALDIGDAKSLPWGDPRSWNSLAQGYRVEQVPADAMVLLTPDAAVLARMETMRRVVVYSRGDPRVAYQVLAALSNRVRDAADAGKTETAAVFDLGYFFEACRQARWLEKEYLGDMNGYSLVMKAIRLAGSSDPSALEMQFAAGLILLEPKGQHPYYPHFKTVVREAGKGTLLEKNLVTHLAKTFEADTLEGMRASKYLAR
jgi:hypothetical protein